ncbi:MAG: hypothetical protein K9K66_11375 [Desulfarculaceae bacterium]|nr:hypothetical protein [Desulfarculaceae bacterium]MCF8070811.1 hypothetical protein [Desulfarculaceae bacterium]MCF8102248.1 hypothetical protein [Desulfarculaceae bacterium]MCF8117690.1 hypothetical protein [Desulfarculaceae bacterium]
MPHLQAFTRNRCTTVEKLGDQAMRSTCRLQDNLVDLMVSLEVSLPGLEISAVSCEARRAAPPLPADAAQRLNKVLGVRVGSGMLKIIEGLVGQEEAYAELSFMVEECCHGLILSLTKQELQKAPREPADSKAHFAGMVQRNTRLINRCAAFAVGSSLVEGLEPPE